RSSVTVNIDLVLDHVRLVPRITRSLTVATEPPLAVGINLSPLDDAGRGPGTSPLERSFPNMTAVTVSAPLYAVGYRFVRWMRDGIEFSINPNTTVVLNSDHALTAVYEEGPPSITKQPLGANVRIGDRFVMEVEAVGTGTLQYQWRRNGEPLSGAQSSIFTIAEVLEGDLGTYDVVVSNGGGEVVSSAAVVGILTATLVNGSFENGLDGWLAAGNLTIQSALPYRTTDGEKIVAFNSGNNVPGGQISQTFATAPGQVYVVSMDTGVLAYNTLEQRMEVNVTGSTSLASRTYAMRGLGNGTNLWVPRSFTFVADGASATLVFRDRSTQTNVIDLLLDNVKVVSMVMRSLVVRSSQVSGVNVSASPPDSLGRSGGATDWSRTYLNETMVTLTAPSTSGAYRFQSWTLNGQVISSNSTLSVNMDADKVVEAVYAAGPPVITRQPVSTSVAPGATASFVVEAAAVGELSYQWRFNGNPIQGANAATYTIASVNTSNAGSYDVSISSPSGAIASSVAVLQITATSVATLTNGSFESGMTGWTGTGNHYVQLTGANPNVNGVRFLVFNGANSTPNGVVSQTFATTPGQSYGVTFRMGVLAFNTLEQRMQVDVMGSSLIRTQTYGLTGLGGGTVRWQELSISFVANSASTTLAFRDRSTTSNAIDLYLDHVRIQGGSMLQPMSAATAPPMTRLVQKLMLTESQAPPAPQLEMIGGEVRLTLDVEIPGLYHLERSDNLLRWDRVKSQQVDQAGPLVFADDAGSEGKMFYRIEVPSSGL
ncbi:MAG: immunoglobulin domain-containing protein, partial [Akkermansiaceae bacterium]|nr:immunoglobulin domain-containing protein [Akkermansiaceae bacterium]